MDLPRPPRPIPTNCLPNEIVRAADEGQQADRDFVVRRRRHLMHIYHLLLNLYHLQALTASQSMSEPADRSPNPNNLIRALK